jgi:hypothetical protein
LHARGTGSSISVILSTSTTLSTGSVEERGLAQKEAGAPGAHFANDAPVLNRFSKILHADRRRAFRRAERTGTIVRAGYENTYLGQPAVTRVVIVKNRLTLDGTDSQTPLPDGTFALGDSVVRFDAYAGNQPQRLSIDATHFYRVELP